MIGMTDDLVALNDLLVGVEMDRHSLPDGEAKVAALGRAIARLRGEAQAEQRDNCLTDDALIAAWEAKARSYLDDDCDFSDVRSEALRECANELRNRQAALSSTAAPERGLPTQRREKAVEAMLADGWNWNWDGEQWTRPPAAPAPVAGGAVARLADELMDASDVEDGDGNPGASIAFADAAGRLRTALAQDRASKLAAPVGVPDGGVLAALQECRDKARAPVKCHASPSGKHSEARNAKGSGWCQWCSEEVAAPTPAAEREVGRG